MKPYLTFAAVIGACALLEVGAFVPEFRSRSSPLACTTTSLSSSVFDSVVTDDDTPTTSTSTTNAYNLIHSLVKEQECFSTQEGAVAFAEACSDSVVFDDRYETQPVVGKQNVQEYLQKKVESRRGRGGVRVDNISDGKRACGFRWTWTAGEQEGLRGTTFVELNDQGLIQYVAEFPEPLFKQGDLTKALLQAVTKQAKWGNFEPFQSKTPTKAHEVAKYLFVDLQNAERTAGIDELMRFWSDDVVYRDFNYEEPFRGPRQVRQFVEDFTFPGIEFKPTHFDDGVDSTCFLWDVVLMDQPDSVRGISFYELDKETRKISYVRDIPESPIKPPIVGKLARVLRPGLGVFQGRPLGSPKGGL